MKTVTLYKYVSPEGNVVSPVKPDTTEYTESFRIIADEGKQLTKDYINYYSCLDVDSTDGWVEVDNSEFTAEQALNIITGGEPI